MTPRDPKPNEKKFLFGFFPNANVVICMKGETSKFDPPLYF